MAGVKPFVVGLHGGRLQLTGDSPPVYHSNFIVVDTIEDKAGARFDASRYVGAGGAVVAVSEDQLLATSILLDPGKRDVDDGRRQKTPRRLLMPGLLPRNWYPIGRNGKTVIVGRNVAPLYPSLFLDTKRTNWTVAQIDLSHDDKYTRQRYAINIFFDVDSVPVNTQLRLFSVSIIKTAKDVPGYIRLGVSDYVFAFAHSLEVRQYDDEGAAYRIGDLVLGLDNVDRKFASDRLGMLLLDTNTSARPLIDLKLDRRVPNFEGRTRGFDNRPTLRDRNFHYRVGNYIRTEKRIFFVLERRPLAETLRLRALLSGPSKGGTLCRPIETVTEAEVRLLAPPWAPWRAWPAQLSDNRACCCGRFLRHGDHQDHGGRCFSGCSGPSLDEGEGDDAWSEEFSAEPGHRRAVALGVFKHVACMPGIASAFSCTNVRDSNQSQSTDTGSPTPPDDDDGVHDDEDL